MSMSAITSPVWWKICTWVHLRTTYGLDALLIKVILQWNLHQRKEFGSSGLEAPNSTPPGPKMKEGSLWICIKGHIGDERESLKKIIPAQKSMVWCGTKSFEWGVLKVIIELEDPWKSNWFTHHKSIMGILQSSQVVRVWQRAYWSHQRPQHQGYVYWEKCSAIGNVLMFGTKSIHLSVYKPRHGDSTWLLAISTLRFWKKDAGTKAPFYTLLSQVLKLVGRDIELPWEEL